MSIIKCNSEEVFKSQLNSSPSKAQYSFPKARRFDPTKLNDNPNFCYEKPSTLDKRGTSFGFGKKYDFTKEKLFTPDPTMYSSSTNMNMIHPRSTAYTFGISRESCKKQYVPGHFVSDPSVPGPGSYSYESKVGKEGAKYTIRAKTRMEKVHNSLNVPGPGTYNTASSQGKCFLSSYKSSPVAIIAPPSHKRFPSDKSSNFPGPGTYKYNDEFLKTGSTLSKFTYSGARKFSQSTREIFEKQKFEIPGPGSYRLPSEFGYVEIKKRTLSVGE